jgi:hypothetical protein
MNPKVNEDAFCSSVMAHLEEELCNTFDARGFKYSIPNVSKMNDKDFKKESKYVFNYIKLIFNNVIGPLSTTLNVVRAVRSIGMFITTIM